MDGYVYFFSIVSFVVLFWSIVLKEVGCAPLWHGWYGLAWLSLSGLGLVGGWAVRR